jgi:hypothetical protein
MYKLVKEVGNLNSSKIPPIGSVNADTLLPVKNTVFICGLSVKLILPEKVPQFSKLNFSRNVNPFNSILVSFFQKGLK